MPPVKAQSPPPPALSNDGGFELGRETINGRVVIFEKSVQPSSRSLLKAYGIDIHEDPITVSSFSKQKKDAHSSDDEEASQVDGNQLLRTRSSCGSVGACSR
jgi:hypothetical protein